MNSNNYSEKGINYFADERLFSKEAILKTLYWYGDRFISTVNYSSGFYHLKLEPITSISEDEIKSAFSKLSQDLIDFQLRQLIHQETQNIRDLITAKAFSDGALDNLPEGDISDPVGFLIK